MKKFCVLVVGASLFVLSGCDKKPAENTNKPDAVAKPVVAPAPSAVAPTPPNGSVAREATPQKAEPKAHVSKPQQNPEQVKPVAQLPKEQPERPSTTHQEKQQAKLSDVNKQQTEGAYKEAEKHVREVSAHFTQLAKDFAAGKPTGKQSIALEIKDLHKSLASAVGATRSIPGCAEVSKLFGKSEQHVKKALESSDFDSLSLAMSNAYSATASAITSLNSCSKRSALPTPPALPALGESTASSPAVSKNKCVEVKAALGSYVEALAKLPSKIQSIPSGTGPNEKTEQCKLLISKLRAKTNANAKWATNHWTECIPLGVDMEATLDTFYKNWDAITKACKE